MKTAAFAFLLLILSSTTATADIVTFGSGGNQFTMEFVPIGNPGNAADTTGDPNPAGSVAQAYRIGKFETSEQMIDKANVVGSLGITKDTRGADKPATSVSWNEAARFVNWLNTSQGFTPAYKFTTQPGGAGYSANSNIALWVSSDAGFNAANPYRNSQAQYFLPSVDEWYKAAYCNPSSGAYFKYPTGSNSAPTAVVSGTAAGTAVYNDVFNDRGPADITLAGGLSPYGTMGQGGNAYEWEETAFSLLNNSSSSVRGIRGGGWVYGSSTLSSSNRTGSSPAGELIFVGFRVASIPNPGGLLGDYNGNGIVDAADYTVWRDTLGQRGLGLAADGTGPGGVPDGVVDQLDYDFWKANFGNHSGAGASTNTAVPEPSTLLMLITGTITMCSRRRKLP